jgi:dipeptidyl aminopeptidase/acylaminoacyl peptidase
MTRTIRRTLLVVAVFILIPALRDAAAQQPAAKRPIQHSDYDSWRAIQAPQISRDGKFVAYSLMPQEGDGDVVVRNLATGAETKHPRGGRQGGSDAPPTTPGPQLAALQNQQRGQGPLFTADSRFVLFTAAPTKAEMDQAKKDKKPASEQPRSRLVIFEPATGTMTRIERVKSFQVPAEASGYVAYLSEAKPEASTPPSAPASTTGTDQQRGQRGGGAGRSQSTAASTPRKKEFGTDLVIRGLADKSSRTIPDVLEFTLSKDGKTLAYVVSSKKEETNGVFVVQPGSSAPPQTLLAGKGTYSKLTWDEKQRCLVFLSDRDDVAAHAPSSSAEKGKAAPVSPLSPAAGEKGASEAPAAGERGRGEGEKSFKVKLYCWERETKPVPVQRAVALLVLLHVQGVNPAPLALENMKNQLPLAAEIVGSTHASFRPGMTLSDKAGLSFSEDGSRLFFGVAPAPPPPQPKTEGATSTPAAEQVTVDLWHWKDDWVKPMQKARSGQERNKTFRTVLHLKDKKIIQLADDSLGDVTTAASGAWALGSDDRAHRSLIDYDTTYADHYLVNLTDGSRKPALAKHHGGITLSPGGKWALFYDGKDWNSLAIPSGKITKLTDRLGVNFWYEDNDVPGQPPSYGAAGWAKDEKSVLLYDRYDIWQVAADGSETKNLTGGMGRKQKLQLRRISLDPEENTVDLSKPLLLRAENEWTRDTGFYRLTPGGAEPTLLVMAARSFSLVAKAKDADVLLLTAQTFSEYPNLLVTNSEFKDLRKVSDANPQQKQVLWGSAELVRYKNADGVQLSGMLVKPENFDPRKKYPLMVYIYERLSQNLHRFTSPQPGTSINITYYASNGYLVFMPDIAYTVGYPGQSALKCVLPGIQALVDKGFVDEKAIGIQGHSWGGYQIAYMVTQTNRFKAASAGAPVSNMISAYDGIRWGTGMPRQFQYEKSQSRIGGTPWQYPLRFVENSPIFMADRVQTPLLMLHNDQDDAVPWYQGIEYYLALRRLGKEVYLFNYNGELHGLRRRVNQKDYTVRLQQFFDHHLKGTPMPEWMANGIPYKPREDTPAPARPVASTEEP